MRDKSARVERGLRRVQAISYLLLITSRGYRAVDLN